MVAHAFARIRRAPWLWPAAAVVALGTLPFVSAGCDRMPLTAPGGTVINIFATSNSAPLNGSVDIIATAIENGVAAPPPSTGDGNNGNGGDTGNGGTQTPTTPSSGSTSGAGTPVQNGTVISFTTTLGRIEPAEAETHNGQVRVRLVTAGQSGTAKITAYSGGAVGTLELKVGAAAVGGVTVSASPTTLGSTGGTATVTARVQDGGGAGVSGIPVNFTTDHGSLSQSVVSTNADGLATTKLTTSVTSVVTATAGVGTGDSANSADVTIEVAPRMGLTISASPDTANSGTPVTFTISANPDANVTSATLKFGDGTSTSLGALGESQTRAHVYNSPGIYTASVTGHGAGGGTETATTDVVISGLQATLDADQTGAGDPVTFTVSGVESAQVDHFEWSYAPADTGGKTSAETSGPSLTRSFAAGAVTMTVHVVGINGKDIAVASTTINVQ